ncbi:YncE family protein [Nocardia sp.]|uniref:YncE family protein n=1 Tax=Nocardia sp. TaxID=1821 RepID=UPI0026183104|nr:YncE family protein [Nocardia sp.]
MAGAVVLVLIAIGAVVIRQQQDSTNPFQSIQVGSTYGYSRAACDSVTGLVYVTNDHDRTVSVVDPAKGTATATIKLADDPEGIAVDPDLHRLYVVGKGAEKGIEGTLIVIDTMTNAVVDTVTTGHSSWGVTVDSGTHSVYVTNLVGLDYNPGADGSSEPNTESSVVVIDPVTASITASIPVGYNAMNLAIDAASRTAYVTGDYHDSTNHSITGLVKVDLATNAVTGQIGLPAETHGVFDVAIDQGARTAYVTSTEQTFVIDLAAGALTGSISISGPGFLGVDPGKHAVYVTGFSGQLQAIKVIDTEKHAVTTTIRAGSKISLRGLVVDPRTHTVYGLDFDQVVVIPR